MDASDSDLMIRLAQGDDHALDLLMRRWGDRVATFLYRMTGRHDVAADLAQETFVKLYQARTRYKPSGSFTTWLFAIATNLGRNHARWLRRHPIGSLAESNTTPESPLPEPADPSRGPDAMAIGHETLATVNRALMELPIDLREALTLFVHEALSHTEIASILGCSPKAVETRIYRARQILKEKLANLRP